MTPIAKILVVDDSDMVRRMLVSYFEDEGFCVLEAATAEQAEALLVCDVVDLLLLDIRLPGKDGLTLTRELRTGSEIGIILVTGRQDEVDRISGLECGADEYVTKPFNPREILARAKNLIRRVQKLRHSPEEGRPSISRVGNWVLDTARRQLVGDVDQVVQLTEGEFQLLRLLMANPGETMSRDQLMAQLKHRSWNATDRTIDVLVGRLRRKLSGVAGDTDLIVTVHGAGYLFSPPVEAEQ